MKLMSWKTSCNVDRGDFLGIIGGTGSGKSTLIDILMGLIIPISGSGLIYDDLVFNGVQILKVL